MHHQKWNKTKAKQENGKCLQDKPPKNHDNNCYRCGMKGHWSRTYRTPKHLVDLYQTSIKEKDEKLLGPKVPYLSAIGAFMYLANCTRPDIAFSVNLLARYSSAPT